MHSLLAKCFPGTPVNVILLTPVRKIWQMSSSNIPTSLIRNFTQIER